MTRVYSLVGGWEKTFRYIPASDFNGSELDDFLGLTYRTSDNSLNVRVDEVRKAGYVDIPSKIELDSSFRIVPIED